MDMWVEIVFEQRLHTAQSIRSTLELLSTLGTLTPTYWGPSDRKRMPWDVDATLQHARESMDRYQGFYASAVYLWRTRSPKWFGSLLVGDMSVSHISLEVSGGLTDSRRKDIVDDLTRLVAKLPVVFGKAVLARSGRAYLDRKLYGHYVGEPVNTRGIHAEGLPPVGYRTWIGGLAAQRVGVDRILDLPHASRLRDDLLQVDLAAEPWKLSPEDATDAFYAVMDKLAPSGMFHLGVWDPDFVVEGRPAPQTVYPSAAAPNWVPPDWIVSRSTKDAAIASGKIPPAAEERALAFAPPVAPAPVHVAPLPEEWLASRETGNAAQGGDLSGRDLRGADFSNMKVNRPVLDGCDLRGTPFAEFSALEAQFIAANASGADFRNVTLLQATFQRARAKGAFFTGARMHVCCFAETNLEDAEFDGAELDSSYFMGAVARGASFRRATGSLLELDDTNLAGADFTEASFPEADFRRSNLSGANFTRAKLSRADFRGADLTGARWTGAVLDGAKFDQERPNTEG